MKTTTYLQKQFANINAVFHSIVDDLTEAEWVMRPAPGENMIGYTVWHMPCTQDLFVQTWIRGLAEVAHSARWSHWESLKRAGISVGISRDQADEIAFRVKQADVLDYTDAVHQEISTWLEACGESELDRMPDPRPRLSDFPEYRTRGFVEEVNRYYDQPVWCLLMRPCSGHIHRHLGELEVVKTILRTQR